MAAGPGDWREYDRQALSAPLAAALAAFAEHGYHGTTVREIAARAGLSVPGLYHHWSSKQSLLVGLTTAVMTDLIERSRRALEGAGADPVTRFEALVECMARFHMFRRNEAFIASSEIRSLEPTARAAYVRRRDEQQDLLAAVIADGVDRGVFATDSPGDAARAISTLCVGIASWFREDGPSTPDEIARRYVGYARGIVGG